MLAWENGKPHTALGDPPPQASGCRMGRRDPARVKTNKAVLGYLLLPTKRLVFATKHVPSKPWTH